MNPNPNYTDELELVSQGEYSTVVSEYISTVIRSTNYESEADLEKSFIEQLIDQGYEYPSITSNQKMVDNLRVQIQNLNKMEFSDSEWNQFFTSEIANGNRGILDKTLTMQEGSTKILRRDDGTTKNIYLIDKTNIHNNNLQVINQYATKDGSRSNRYDVTVLVNGLPLVHIELKRRGVALKEAFNQIERYQKDSFWAASGLFEYVQLFVISNGTQTKYYSNTTRNNHIKGKDGQTKIKKTSHSFEFTSWWADAKNQPIWDLMDFARTFFAKHTILNILTKYCVFTAQETLMVMRPYQIVATERIMDKIQLANTYKKHGTIDAGGYVWHTTGSGKTLTSFKTAQLVSKLDYVDKVLFVVDRKDLDYQTMKEYDKFQKDAANSSKSTRELAKHLDNPNSKIIVTTIQKLDRFISGNKGHEIFGGKIVLIFDECHRSQFGQMHTAITKAFKKYYMFGFTGTPIFADNANTSKASAFYTTEQAFGQKLHTYTIVDAISDKNVLPFKVDYLSTMRQAEDIEDTKISDIDRQSALMSSERITKIVTYIREHFDQKTKRNESYQLNQRRLRGFNSIFAVSSIEFAKKYYTEFQAQIKNLPTDQKLKVGIIYSFGANQGTDLDPDIDENSDSTSDLDQSSKDFLAQTIKDYNYLFGTNYDISDKSFGDYYKDLSMRVKDRELDILIVVNMFLTGFDATTLNTLWVDKNLRHHGLLQAYSRTNRILNSVKTAGNIICFRNLETATNQALAMFGNSEARGVVLIRPYKDYLNGYVQDNKVAEGYLDLVGQLKQNYPQGQRITSEQAQKDFVKLYGNILKLRNTLTNFDQFEQDDILSQKQIQNYHGMYLDLYQELRVNNNKNQENINDDLVFEIELIKQVEVNIDYILGLIRIYLVTQGQDKDILENINRAVNSSFDLRNKKDLINTFITNLDMELNLESDIDEIWHSFVQEQKITEINTIITEEKLKEQETLSLMQNAFNDGFVPTLGTAISSILPPISRFSATGDRSQKQETVIIKLKKFFDRFFNIANGKF